MDAKRRILLVAGYATAMATACTRAIQKLDEQFVAELEEKASKLAPGCSNEPLPPIATECYGPDPKPLTLAFRSQYGNYYPEPDIKQHVAQALQPCGFVGFTSSRAARRHRR
jgi:hypothetical protein